MNYFLLLILLFIPIVIEFFLFYFSNSRRSTNFIFSYCLNKFGFTSFNFKTIQYALLLAIILLAGNFLLVLIFSFFPANDLHLVGISILNSLKDSFILFSLYLLFTVFVEEFFFRAFLTDIFGIWISTFFFALLHFGYGSVFEMIGAFLLGLILAYTWKKTKNFYIVFIGHLIYNVVAIIFLFVFG